MQTWKRILSCLAALCLTLALLGGLTWLTQKKDSYAKHAEFFEQKADYDVFFIGSSRMMNGVFPMELWARRGIVSYNLAQAGHPTPAYYWIMRLALDYKQPKLMVIDCYGMQMDVKTTAVFGLMHISMDSFPLSLNKIRAAFDMLDDPYMGDEYNEGERRSAFNLLWTFPVFHSRWNQLTEEDFRPQKNMTRGAIANNEMFWGEFVPDDSEKGSVTETVGMDYLRRAIEECQSRGIEVLLTYIPLFADAKQQAMADYAGRIAEEYGIDYVNFFDMDVANYHVDFADSAGHLNTAGARKITDYLGNYITKRYGIPDRRGEAAYDNWERDYALYVQKKDETLKACEDLRQYLMLLTRDSVDIVMRVSDRSLYRDPTVTELLRGLGLREKPGEDAKLLLIRNGGESAEALTQLPENLSGFADRLEADGTALRILILRDGQEIDCADYDYLYDETRGELVLTGAVHRE